ncbi:tyrosyl-DNA phosphodiesterase-domain-containing protein [Fusarium solani]|uniref:Tyrosyl-DNA phosphodiesterase-domain-containing protein n=1 Tax=Fusarium solani TaxID=169388 RepID=A0A9P9HLW6_FUSSL|nr:tyrosyl-DNA phosphodiesterase-domain-containing protein [Fusarium solani]KAH7260044.1 tyrosyl-DNA phosphodiesterase-domain-containing protein [Fusarium solani]
MTGSRQDVPDPGSDMDEDEALRYAIALSLQDQENQDQQTSSQVPLASASSASSSRRNGTGSGGASFGLLSLDRKKMEQERLQRLAKRRRSPLDEDDDDVVEVPPPKRKTPVEPPRSLPGPSPSPPFPGGVVKRTWARGYPRTSEDIKIEEVFQKDRLELAVLSSYQWDDEWLLSKIDLRRTKLLLVAYAADESQKREMQSNTPPGIRFCFPAMNGPGAMHSKLQLLKYPDYLRVVVPTANLVPYDWGETGVMENMVFLIDLPKLEASVNHQPTHFSTELGRFLSETGVGAGMVSSLSNYDFSRTKHLGFVYTIPGGHVGDSLKRIGHCGLGNSVASLGLATDDPVEVDIVCASLGSLNYDLVGAMYNACRGDDGLAEYKSRIGRTGAAAKNKSSSPWAAKLKDRFRIYFPTDETVAQSRGGRMAAGTICVQPKWWRSATFPTELVRDCVNTREGLLMHSKMIFVRRVSKSTEAEDGAGQSRAEPRLGTRRGQHEPDRHDENDDSAELNAAVLSPGWAYVGSANLSESAW